MWSTGDSMEEAIAAWKLEYGSLVSAMLGVSLDKVAWDISVLREEKYVAKAVS
jgi:hypothetical protein